MRYPRLPKPWIDAVLDEDAERVARRVQECIPRWYSVEDVLVSMLRESGGRPVEARLLVESIDRDPRMFSAFVETFGSPVSFPWAIGVFVAGVAIGMVAAYSMF